MSRFLYVIVNISQKDEANAFRNDQTVDEVVADRSDNARLQDRTIGQTLHKLIPEVICETQRKTNGKDHHLEESSSLFVSFLHDFSFLSNLHNQVLLIIPLVLFSGRAFFYKTITIRFS